MCDADACLALVGRSVHEARPRGESGFGASFQVLQIHDGEPI
jgi:hypothetical protein